MGNLVMFSSIFSDENVDNKLKEILPADSIIGIIPAETRFFKKSLLEESGEVVEYRKMGYEQFCWFDLGYNYNPLYEDELFKCDAIHLCGGNTFLLLYLLKRRGFIEKLREYYKNGGTIMGNSAGSIVMCPNITTAAFADYNITYSHDYESLGLVNFLVKPHWEQWISKETMFQMYADQTNQSILTLKENQCIIKTEEDGLIAFNNPVLIQPRK